MNTEDLIEALSRDDPGARRVGGRWALLLVAALGLCLAALALAFGPPLTALPRIGAAPYAMKLAFAVSVAVVGALALRMAGLPGRRLATGLAVLALPFVAVLGLTAMELAATEPAWPGRTWFRCLSAIALLTPLGFAASVLALRRLAPTRLRVAGALAGIVAAAIAASGYALWCPETTAVFLLAWYAGPMLVAGAAGALLGPRLLRW